MREISLDHPSEEGTRVGPRVFLVPVSVGQPDSQDLCETKEETDSTYKAQHLSSIFFNDWSAGRTMVAVFKAAGEAGVIRVKAPEATAVQISLDVIPGTGRVVPSHLQKLALLFLVQG